MKMNKATITLEYNDARTAGIVAKILDIDNKIAPKKLKIQTINKGSAVITRLEHRQQKTLFATIDDLVFTEKLISSLIGPGA